jgi:hypothetical protein
VCYRGKPVFDSPQEELAEFHHTQTSGLNPETMKNTMEQAGFQKVMITYRHTTNPKLSLVYRFFLLFLKILSYILPLKSFYTHFYLIARK